MKKKVKLFSTIASLCLAVALMAFGVWAATTASVGVTSTITYTVSGQVDMTFKIEVEYITEHVNVENREATKYNAKSDPKTGDTTKTVNSWELEQKPGQTALNERINLGDYTFNEKSLEGDTIVYTITLTNNSDQSAWVEVSGFTPTSDKAVTSAVTNGASGAVEGKGVFTYVVTFTLADATKSFAVGENAGFTPTFAITANTNTKPGA